MKPAILGGTPTFDKPIQFLRPPMDSYGEQIAEDLKEIFKTNWVTDGPTVKKFEEKVGGYIGSSIVGLNCCTAGLMMTARLLGLHKQEVILPSYTFSATAIAMAWNDCEMKFVDMDQNTFNLSAQAVQEAITDKTKGIVATHIFGNPCDVDALQKIADEHSIPLFFDAAHALGSSYKGKKVGNFGNAEIFSCSPTKIMSTVEGGIVSSSDEEFLKKMKICRNYGVLENYDIAYQGMCARLEEVNAAVGLRYMDDIDTYVQNRNSYASLYKKKLGSVPGVRFQQIQENATTTYKDFALVLDPDKFGMNRDVLEKALLREGIPVKKYFYPPQHKTTLLKKYNDVKLPVTESISANVICPPIYNVMEQELIEKIADAIIRIQEHASDIN